jgi:hypothetical protein
VSDAASPLVRRPQDSPASCVSGSLSNMHQDSGSLDQLVVACNRPARRIALGLQKVFLLSE